MLELIIAIVLLIISIVYINSTFGKFQRAINKVHGPPSIPILGNIYQVGNNPSEILNNLLNWCRKYPGKFRVWIGLEANIVISEPRDVEVVLSSMQILRKSNIYDLLHPWLGNGLLTSTGTHWHKHRKMITPSFHFKILVQFLEVMNKNSSKFMEKLKESSKDGVIFDIQSLICNCTLDVICETAMAVNINAMDDADSDVVKAFKYMCYSIQMRSFSPLKRHPHLFKLTPEYRTYKKNLDILHDFTKDVISKRQNALHNNAEDTNSQSNDDDGKTNIRQKQAFLDTLLTTTIDGKPLTLQEIYEEVSTFMFEGHDTTASGISFAVYLLSRHKDVQRKVFDEQVSIFGNDLTREATYADVQEMKYLDIVIKEAQRLYPSVPIIGRFTDEPFNLNGTIIPKGATINLLLMAMGYNEQSFPDPYKFDPDRFDPDKREKVSPYEYVPFSAGPRNCIGQKFAQMELKSIVGKIVRTFQILPPEDSLYSKDGYEPKIPRNKFDAILSSVLTLKSENGINIRLKQRNA